MVMGSVFLGHAVYILRFKKEELNEIAWCYYNRINLKHEIS